MSINEQNNENIVEKLIGTNHEYITVSPEDFKKGHGGGLSVKIVLPCFCQAKCPFCFNQLTTETQMHDYDKFFENLPKTLDMIFDNITERPISLDITGNEPTFDVKVFCKFMEILKKYKDKTDKIVLTTNGFHIVRCLGDLIGVVDIINFSLHHYDYNKRKNIFKTEYIPDDRILKDIVEILKEAGTTSTAVAVLYEENKDFYEFYQKFVSWAQRIGFKDIRMRSNFRTKDKFIDDIFAMKMENESINEVGGLKTKIIVDESTGFETYILKGVPDLTDYVVGAELVIDDDGNCYIDYNKRYPVNESNVNYFNSLYIFNDNEPKKNQGPTLNRKNS